MGKITGFLEFDRIEEGYAPVAERSILSHWKNLITSRLLRSRITSRCRNGQEIQGVSWCVHEVSRCGCWVRRYWG